MKILFATPFEVPGGITRVSQHIITHYKKINPEGITIIVMPMDRGTVQDTKTPLGRALGGLKDYWSFAQEEKRILKTSKYDLVHIASSASISIFKDILMVRYAHKYGAKAIVHFHFGRIPELQKMNNWEWKVLKKVVSMADAVIVLDKDSYNTLISEGYTNVHIVPNPIAPRVINIIDAHKDVERIPRTILFVGQHLVAKGIHELVAACKRIPDIKLKMIGSVQDNVRNRLKAEADNGDWLEITGEMPFEQVIKETHSCEVYCLPTYTEGFPNAILESMACGCAIVTTPVGAIPSMLEEEDGKKFGIMVEPRNVDQLHDAIVKFLEDSDLRKTCGINAMKRVNERYNIEAIWNELSIVWKSLE